MKDFSKYVLATVVGTIISSIVVVVLGVMCIVGIVAASSATHAVTDNSVLVINLKGTIGERSDDSKVASWMGDDFGQTGLNDILSAIKKAKANDKIKGIYLEAGALSTGYSTLSEIRNALTDFKKSGKWIISYGDVYTQGAYYVASVADKVYLNPSGEADLHGLATQTMFVKDMYEKIGIRFQIIKVGKYKSAPEAYSESSMSEANRKQVSAFVNGMWDNIAGSIAESRGVSKAEINALADKFTAFLPQKELVESGLIDSLAYSNGVKAIVKERLGIKESDEINQLTVADMRSVKGEKTTGEEVAVYYAEGSILDNDAESGMSFGGAQIVGTKVCKDLDKLLEDENVKAVVLRVNSPGGSAYASEQIWQRVAKLKEKKPVVVSMGDYAASGGYYISCNAAWIVAEPTTLTGSIGIYGIVPEASSLLEKKLSLHFDGVKTNKHADFGSGLFSFAQRPLDTEERQMLQKYIERGYALFRQRVADGRQRTVNQIEEIAQGHVWLGKDALAIHLVDQLGTLDDAVAKAAELAELDDYHVAEYPEEKSWFDILTGSDSDNGLLGSDKALLENKLQTLLGDWYLPFVCLKSTCGQSPVQALMPFFVSIN